MPDVADALERELGSPVSHSAPYRWGSKNQTRLVELANGRRIVVQTYSDREAGRVRLQAAEQLAQPLIERGVPVPRVVAHDLDGAPAWAAFEELPGEPGYVAAGDDLADPSFSGIARHMGQLAGRIADLDPATFDLPRWWADSGAVSKAAGPWLADLAPYMPTRDVSATRDILEQVPPLFAGRRVAVCHGDYGPQNVLVVGDRVTGLVDLEDARIADPLLDAAWWAWLVRAHTPAAFSRTWATFLDAAGLNPRQEGFDERLLALIVLRLLETADAFRRSAPAKHPSWGRRLSGTLAWRGRPLD